MQGFEAISRTLTAFRFTRQRQVVSFVLGPNDRPHLHAVLVANDGLLRWH
jgi:hypothetical protein